MSDKTILEQWRAIAYDQQADRMEWGGIWAYNSGSGSYYAGGKLRSAQT